jgi:hypothetical protein
MPDPGSPRQASRDRIGLWLLVVLVATAAALGIWLRLALLGAGSLWLDELWTLDAVSRSFKEMIGARLVSDQSPPLFTVLTWLWLRVTGTYDPSAMRFLSMGFGSLAILAPLAGAVTLRSIRPALLVVAALFALSLFPLQYSVELRAYSTMIGLSTVSTVVWAGLLSGDLPRSGRWISVFALTGALAGFAHYYGNLPYVAELLVLAGTWLRTRPHRPLYLLLGCGSVSLIPVVAWFAFTQPWFPNHAVAPPPSFGEINNWADYAFSPVTTILHGLPAVYHDTSGGLGLSTLAAVALAIGMATVFGFRGRATVWERSQSIRLGTYAIAVVVVGLALAWFASVVRPPSMNYRNLAALLPPLFLAVACASTPGRSERTNHWTGALIVVAWGIATMAVIGQSGVTSLTPPWQAQAGYRATVRTLLASTHEEPAVALIGLKLPWDWHGEWDAAARAELGLPPAESDGPAPLHVRWILDVQELRPSGMPDMPLIVFTDARDQRSADLFAWVQEVRDGCQSNSVGGPGFGVVDLLRCLAPR